MGRLRAFAGRRLSGFRGEDLGFVGIRALVGVFRAFAGGSFRAFVARVSGFRDEGFREEDFEFWWGGFWGRVSGFGGEDFGLSWGSWGDSGFGGEALGFRGRIWAFVGDFGLSWGDSGFRGEGFGLSNRFYEFKAPLKRTDFANRIDFTRLELRAAPLKRELTWAPSCAGEP